MDLQKQLQKSKNTKENKKYAQLIESELSDLEEKFENMSENEKIIEHPD